MITHAKGPKARRISYISRSKHKSRAAFSTLLGSSKVCPCCHTEFSSRPRLLAHVSERRNRGGRRYSCNTLFATGLVHPPSHDELQSALEADKETRTLARKSGHTVPLSECLAKRPRVGTTVLEQQRARKRMLDAGHGVTSLPANALHLCDLRPRKRFRSKSSQEEVVLQHISQ